MEYLVKDEILELKYQPGKGAWTYHIQIPNTKHIVGKWGSMKVSGTIDNYKIETYLCSEYDIIHYREMQTLKFTLSKVYKKEYPSIPHSFILYKSSGFDFEPYINVKRTVFRETRADK